MDNTQIAWFRRDLRLDDNPAMSAAVAQAGTGGRVVPLFVLEPRLVGASTMSPARLAYLCDALADLDGALRERGSHLVLRRGDARTVVPRLAAELGAAAVHVAQDVTPLSAPRDAEVRRGLAPGVALDMHPGVMIQPPGSVQGSNGDLPRVYTSYRRRWEQVPLRAALPAPVALPDPGAESEPLPTTGSLGVKDRVPAVLTGGEHAARERFERFLAMGVADYVRQRDIMGAEGTSRMSADLKYGCLSPLAAYRRLDRSQPGQENFAQELIWRDFYGHVMARWPETRTTEFNADLRDLPWRQDGELLEAWKQGRTGYPIVDAGMRQLRALGWMHNRARMVTASFLCKDLLVDWRLGVDAFMEQLVDGDVASNNGGWQWAAGTGTDAQPFFRIFNPVLQGEKFDPDGTYVRTYVPELRAVPSKWIHHPWEMPATVAADSGVVIGQTYPAPIVDHSVARRQALAFFKQRALPAD